MRAIDVDVLKEKLIEMQQVYNKPYEHYDNGFQDAVSQIDDALDNLPTIDSVKHGTWLEINHTCGYHRTCSECGWTTDSTWILGSIENEKYCPNCGARMNGDKE